jgi:DNA replication licensing factor MCM7
LYIKPLTPPPNQKKSPGLAVRDVKGAELGHLITVSGIVTRVSDVKPAVEVQAYTCDRCGTEVFQEVKRREFGPLIECPGECKTNDGKGQLFMSTRASKFNPFQDVKIQELTHQVPTGHIPRSLTVHLYGPITRTVSPGDVVDISGIFLPIPYTGFKAVRAGLLTDTLLEAQYIEKKIKQYSAIESTAEIEEKINRLREGDDVYGKIAKSIAPEIYGHEDVKKALLLLLVGGVTKEMGDGMRIRGDINICLMGDPGVAKSQLLKYMSKVAPRGVYTTGRGSSGVGLTAAVMRDPVTDEMVLGMFQLSYLTNEIRGWCTCSRRQRNLLY